MSSDRCGPQMDKAIGLVCVHVY